MLSSISILSSAGDVLVLKHFEGDFSHVIDSFVSVKDQSSMVNLIGEFVCIKVEMNDIYFLAIAKQEVDVAQTVEIIYLFASVVKDTLGKIDSESVKDNFSKVLLALDEIYEHGGPFTHTPHVLSSYMKKPKLFSSNTDKYMEDSLSNEQMTDSPWRARGVKYTLNEILIDVIEFLHCVIDKHWTLEAYHLVGNIQVKASLTGMPDLTAFMHVPHDFLHYSLHQSAWAQRKRFTEERALVFTPPDTTFVVFKYIINNLKPSLPFQITPTVSFEEESMKIEMRAESRMIIQDRYNVEDFKVSFLLPKICGTPNVAVNGGNFVMEGSKACWNIGKLTEGKTMQFTATVPVPLQFITSFRDTQITADVHFQVIGYNPSGTRIDKVMARGENYAPYKGARCVYRSGKVELRLN